jgi:hypothetical protein
VPANEPLFDDTEEDPYTSSSSDISTKSKGVKMVWMSYYGIEVDFFLN